MISVNLSKTLPGITVHAEFAVGKGCTVLFGASGAGKSTVVNMLSGLLTPDEGRVEVGGRTLFDSARGINLPPEKRNAGYVFQDSRLFPHMSVKKNLLYGMKKNSGGRHSLYDVAALLGIESLMDRYPNNLSGGEKQRVALGRALLSSPDFLLMDEPMASLDNSRRDELIRYIAEVSAVFTVPVIYVTHTIDEIMRLADYLGIMSAGRLTRFGGAIEVLNSREFICMLPPREAGVVSEGVITEESREAGLSAVSFCGKTIEVPHSHLKTGTRVRFKIPAMDVVLSTRAVSTSARNIYEGTVTETNFHDHLADVLVDIGGFSLWARISQHSCEEMGLRAGGHVYAVIKSVTASHMLYDRPPESGGSRNTLV